MKSSLSKEPSSLSHILRTNGGASYGVVKSQYTSRVEKQIGLQLSSTTGVFALFLSVVQTSIYGSLEPSLSAAGRSLHWQMQQRTFQELRRFGGGFFQAANCLKSRGPFLVLWFIASFIQNMPALCYSVTSPMLRSALKGSHLKSGFGLAKSLQLPLQKQTGSSPSIRYTYMRSSSSKVGYTVERIQVSKRLFQRQQFSLYSKGLSVV